MIRTVREYEKIGVAGFHLEDQVSPKKCGHYEGKEVISKGEMIGKIKAAADTRQDPDLVIIARTDARAVHGLDEALRRAELYLKAGADGLFVEAPQSVDELARVGRTFQGVPQIANMVEGGGRTPVLPADELFRLGFAMVAYPTTLIFRVARAIEDALADLKAGRSGNSNDSVGFEAFKEITGLERWAAIEQRFGLSNGPRQKRTAP